MAGIEIKLDGSVQTVVLANVRHGAPNTSAPVARKVAAGTALSVSGLVIGQTVQGNAHWYHLGADTYIWTGACGPFQALATPVEPVPAPARQGEIGDRPVPMVVDLYHGDVVQDFATAYRAGLRGIIHKATTGASGVDDLYATRRRQALDAGLLWGAYHWGTAAPAADQVNHFLSVSQPESDTLVALDFETTNGNQMDLERGREFLQILAERLGRKAVIYSGSTIKAYLGNRIDPFFGQHRLWLAQYGNAAHVQPSWSSFWLWQYTDGDAGPGPKTVPGISGNASGFLDCSYYSGTETTLAAEWAS